MTRTSRARTELERLLDEGGGALEGRVGGLSLDRLRELASARAVDLERTTPPMRKRISRELFALGVPTLALYQIVREQGVEQAEAVAALDALIQAAYRVRLASPLARAVATRLFRLPVVRNSIVRAVERAREPGGFVMRRVEAPDADTLVALDVERCPLAELFARHGAPEIGPLICKIDDLMAEAVAGIELRRTGTIASGAPRCDFRYRRAPSTATPESTS